MTKEQIEKLRQPVPEYLSKIFVPHEGEDEHGYYSTGLFIWKGKLIFVNLEGGKWHLSASCNHVIGYYELKELRYNFLPNSIYAAQIFPPREEFINIHENCYHLYQVD